MEDNTTAAIPTADSGVMPNVETPVVTPETNNEEAQDIAALEAANDIESLRTLIAQKDQRIKEVNAEAAARRIGKREAESRLEALQAQVAQREAELKAQADKEKAELTARLQQESDVAAQTRAELEQAKLDARNAQIESWKIRAGTKYALPEALVSRLSGNTLEEIMNDAALIAQSLPQRTVSADGDKGSSASARTADIALRERKEQMKSKYKL